MSADAGREQALPAPLAAPRAIGGRGAWRVLTCAAALLFALGWTLVQGKDLHWDALNYHLYLGFSALNDRFAQDFFAAGAPSYLNPYAYVPLYLMVKAGVPALWIAVAFATFHATILWLVFEIGVAGGLRGERSAAWRVRAAWRGASRGVPDHAQRDRVDDRTTSRPASSWSAAGWHCAHALRSGRLALLVVAAISLRTRRRTQALERDLCGGGRAGPRLSSRNLGAARPRRPGLWRRLRRCIRRGSAAVGVDTLAALRQSVDAVVQPVVRVARVPDRGASL